MGENEWLNGYLEAILDAGSASKRKKMSATRNLKMSTDDMLKLEKMIEQEEKQLLFNPTKKYFVQGVVDSFDETHLYRTWIKVITTRKFQERPNRLENICWRIWHLTRKKKQIAWDNRQKLVKQRHEREKGRIDAAEDLSEISEGEKEKAESSNDLAAADYISRISSDNQIWSEGDSRKLYIVLISLHGLVRGEDMELGRDSDTGGQVKYVVELAWALANTEGVSRVDLLTRQITSPDVDSTYGEPIEMLCCPTDGYGSSCGTAYIIRIPCGPRDKYIPKESLWPYIGEFVDGALGHIVNVARALGDQQEVGSCDGKPLPTWPYVIHGHYADAGEVAARLSGVLNVPMVLTGHSLGRNKLEQLLKQGRLSREGIDTTYNIMRRIEAEELSLDSADMVVTSTSQEIEEQWGLYDGFDIQVERKLRIRRRRGVTCLGRCMPKMAVIPPGIDFSSVTAAPDSLDVDGDLGSFIGPDRKHKRPIPPIWSEIMRFFTNPHKPMILALSRPDPKKNVTTLLEAFGECQQLRELANLTLILGNRDDIEEMSSSTSSVLTTVLKLIDKYDLYGQVAYPKHHKQPDVPEIYRLAGKTKGVFINPALVEPFGLTLIEAAAYGLPIIATQNGGPVDIVKALNNGLLVDPHDHKAISDALLRLVADKNLWHECRKNDLKYIHRFSCPAHCRNYLSHIEQFRKYHHPSNHLSVTPLVNSEEEPLSESLRGVEDFSLKFSIDVDVKTNEELADILIKRAADSSRKPIKNSYCPPGRKKQLYAIAVDSYDSNGTLPLIIKNIKQIADTNSSQIGLVLLTSLSLVETGHVLASCQVKAQDFDALVCSSGSEMYFPWKNNVMTLDEDYENHIDYRWPGQNVKSTAMRLAENDVFELLTGDCSSHCYSYSVKPKAKAPKIDELRQKLRMRGIRCNLVYTHASSRLNVIPLYASRAQALRYLSVIWSIDLSKVTVFLGTTGDTDYQDLVRGIHKSVILKYPPVDSCVNEDSNLLGYDDEYRVLDAQKSKKIAFCEGLEANDLSKVLAFGNN